MSTRRWISVPQLAEYLGIHRRSAYSLVERGIVPHTRLPGVGIRIDRLKLDGLLEDRERKTVAEQLDSI